MAILGLGTDITEIARIEKALTSFAERFPHRILTDAELHCFLQMAPQARLGFFAKRFAAKEATVKALGTGFRQGIEFKEIEIYNDNMGKPCLKLSGKALQIAKQLGVNHWHLSLSDEKHYAMATVIAES